MIPSSVAPPCAAVPREIGMTLAEWELRGEGDRVTLRNAYAAMMRRGEGVALPEPETVVRDEDACKFALRLAAGGEAGRTSALCESVLLPMGGYHFTNWMTLCVSTQLGCRMNCAFCQTARMGLVRNLTAAEIVMQRLVARTLVTNPPEQRAGWTHESDGIRNIVFMGMGEPLDNVDEVTRAIEILSEPKGLAIPFSAMTLSTSGHVPGIRKLAAKNYARLRLAISLNAARDELRTELMPINKAWPLAELKDALMEFPLHPRDKFFIEYVLLRGRNDSDEDVRAIAEFCRGLPAAINVLTYNNQSSPRFEPSPREEIRVFMKKLQERGLFVKMRVSRGSKMMAACGQLGAESICRQENA